MISTKLDKTISLRLNWIEKLTKENPPIRIGVCKGKQTNQHTVFHVIECTPLDGLKGEIFRVWFYPQFTYVDLSKEKFDKEWAIVQQHKVGA